VATVGGIRSDLPPGVLVVPHQIIDYTYSRKSTFFEGSDMPVIHADFTQPYSGPLRERLIAAAAACGETVVDGATYACTQGPRLETAAEIERIAREGGDVVGMTGMPEAVLAREAGLQYAALALVINHAAGRGDSVQEVKLEELTVVMEAMVMRAVRILSSFFSFR
jgi:5'-methylthioadenosine phosphorylase